VNAAVRSLRHFSGKGIRDFALDQIPKAKQPGIYIDLLVANYQSGDDKLLKSLIDKTKNEYRIHDLAISIIDVFKANKAAECLEPLVAVYGKLNCGIHRTDLIEIMVENEVLPDKISQEIQYDSYHETRKFCKLKNKGAN
jgi:hypothetical protein